jgi:hypothetical protein
VKTVVVIARTLKMSFKFQVPSFKLKGNQTWNLKLADTNGICGQGKISVLRECFLSSLCAVSAYSATLRLNKGFSPQSRRVSERKRREEYSFSELFLTNHKIHWHQET